MTRKSYIVSHAWLVLAVFTGGRELTPKVQFGYIYMYVYMYCHAIYHNIL